MPFLGAAPAENVVRERPAEGDVVILVGGRTGRDGCGGATGSSKERKRVSDSVKNCENILDMFCGIFARHIFSLCLSIRI